jgi:hypothetical protein
MHLGFQLVSLQTMRRGLLALGAIAALAGGGAQAQNLDQGKPPARLFKDGCAECHHSARGLAKGRFSLTLFLFLQQHYSTSASSAWTLTSYLESLDRPQRRPARTAAAKKPPANGISHGSVRPPQLIPER